MTSPYLTEEASNRRMIALLKRMADEAIPNPCGGVTWEPESDFWSLPKSVQVEVLAYRAIDAALDEIVKKLFGSFENPSLSFHKGSVFVTRSLTKKEPD